MKKYVLALVFAMAVGGAAHAQTNPVDFVQDSVRPFVAEQRDAFKQDRMELQENRQNIKNRAQAAKAEITEQRAMLHEENQGAKAQLKEALGNAQTEEERKAIMEAAHEEHATNKDQFRADAQEKRSAVKEDIGNQLENRIDLVVRKFNAYVDRGDNIVSRINSQLAKMEEAGYDVTIAAALRDTATEHLANAQVNMDEALVFADQINIETMTREYVKLLLADMKTEFTEAREDLKAAFATIRETVAEMKSIRSEDA